MLLETLRGPVKIIAFVIFLHVGLTVFKWPDQAQTFLSKGLIVIVAFSLTYVALKIVDLFMGLWRERTAVGADKSFDEQLYPIIRKSIKLFVVIVAVLVTGAESSDQHHGHDRLVVHRRSGHRSCSAGHAREFVRRGGGLYG